MEYKVDLAKMIESMKNAEATDPKPEFIETFGEKYIFENIIKKSIANKAVVVSDINFDEFDEDDIVRLIDDKLPYIEDKFDRIGQVVSVFMNSPAKALTTRSFF